jgi:hypothetical protein
MDIIWQQIIIGVLLVGAVGYLGWHFARRARRKSKGCAACGLMRSAEKKHTGENQPTSR